jgi:molybdate transport system substrate-binding protein
MMAHMRTTKRPSTTAIGANASVADWSADWEVAVRVWIERHGKAMLGESLADLLSAIEQTSSISAAARALGISYRHAWQLVQEGNTAAGEPLVSAAVGGLNGGGARLTARGQLSLEIFEQLRGQVRETAAGLLQNVLHPTADLVATIHLAAAISLQDVIGQLLTEYALRHPSVRVRAVYGASNELADHVLAGAPCDLFISADPVHLDPLQAAGRLRDQSRTAVAANSLAAIGPCDQDEPLRTPGELASARVSHLVLADPASPLGKCSQTYLQGLGLYEAVLEKVVHVDNSRAVLAAIRSGRADAGLAFASDAAKAADCRVLFQVNAAAAALSYWGAIVHGSPRENDAQRLLDFFSTPVAQQCFRRCGLTLPKKRRSAKQN